MIRTKLDWFSAEARAERLRKIREALTDRGRINVGRLRVLNKHEMSRIADLCGIETTKNTTGEELLQLVKNYFAPPTDAVDARQNGDPKGEA